MNRSAKTAAALLAAMPLLLAADPPGGSVLEQVHDGLSDRKSPFGEMGVYELDPIFNYLSSYGLTARHDIQTTTGGSTIGVDNGFINLTSGTGSSDSALLQSVRPGIYAAGRSAEAGQGIIPKQLPATNSSGYIRWGAYNINSSGNIGDGSVAEITDDDNDGNLELCFSYYANSAEKQRRCGIEKASGTVQSDNNESFNGDPVPSGFDPFAEGFVSVMAYNWYGIGGVSNRIYYPKENGSGTVGEWDVHTFVPASGESFSDPNLFLRQEANAGDSGGVVELNVGGRRFDVTGKDERDSREVGAVRVGQSLTDGTLAATVCVRRETEYPAGTGRENTVSALAENVRILTSGQVTYYVSSVASVSGGTWETAGNTPDDESALEFNTGVTGFGAVKFSTGPLPGLGSGNNKALLNEGDAALLPLRDTEPLCVLAQGEGATPTVDTYMTMIERQ
jgi:hypothetical protein